MQKNGLTKSCLGGRQVMMIDSGQLVDIDDFSKELVNQGVYCLYSVDHDSAKYLLKANDKLLLLSDRGTILSEEQEIDFSIVKDNVYFSDIPFPPSINSVKIA